MKRTSTNQQFKKRVNWLRSQLEYVIDRATEDQILPFTVYSDDIPALKEAVKTRKQGHYYSRFYCTQPLYRDEDIQGWIGFDNDFAKDILLNAPLNSATMKIIPKSIDEKYNCSCKFCAEWDTESDRPLPFQFQYQTWKPRSLKQVIGEIKHDLSLMKSHSMNVIAFSKDELPLVTEVKKAIDSERVKMLLAPSRDSAIETLIDMSLSEAKRLLSYPPDCVVAAIALD